ncbi:MAG TPA: tetratricopeptide repeat protein, partial [Gammaproteobacteria bacterium]|nr:tetratricopeptide repeat protein [Gammaproteobacteria bacterium]
MNPLQRLPCVLLLVLFTGCTTIGEDGKPIDQDKKNAEIAHANTMLGIEYLRSGDYEKSREKLNRALAADPDSAEANDAIAVLYE